MNLSHIPQNTPSKATVLNSYEPFIFSLKRDFPEESDGMILDYQEIQELPDEAFEESFDEFTAQDFKEFQIKLILRESIYNIEAAAGVFGIKEVLQYVNELHKVAEHLVVKLHQTGYEFPVKVSLKEVTVELL
jgi:hypothetical protein